MKIRKFNEAELQDISSDRINEIIESMREMLSDINQKGEVVDSLINELNNFRSNANSNDQIDDSIANFQFIRSYFSDITDKVDSVINSMENYNKSGRKFLY